MSARKDRLAGVNLTIAKVMMKSLAKDDWSGLPGDEAEIVALDWLLETGYVRDTYPENPPDVVFSATDAGREWLRRLGIIRPGHETASECLDDGHCPNCGRYALHVWDGKAGCDRCNWASSIVSEVRMAASAIASPANISYYGSR